MAVDSNGRVGEPKQRGMNGHATATRSKTIPKQKRFSILSTITRILTWYSIVTILFRCPSTFEQLTDSSPKICNPYFQARSATAPHIQPYYDRYAAAYVDAAQPYYENLETRVFTPIAALGKKYGAPRIVQAQAFAQAQWAKNLQPEVLKYQTILQQQYDRTLGPHVDKAVTASSPYYNVAKNSAFQTYYEHILPTYTTVQPYASQGYRSASAFTVNTAIPYTKWAWTTSALFLERSVWPKLRILYGENVEPQLVRIGERLGRYRDGKRIKAAADEVESSASATSTLKSFLSVSSSVASAHMTIIPETSHIETPSTASESAVATPESEKEVREKAQKVVAQDLRVWQEKFAKAADEGSDDLEERIAEITDRLTRSQAEKVGQAHIIELEEIVKSSLESLKRSIVSIAKDVENIDHSEDALNTAVRKAGVAIKEKAQSIRNWRQNYDHETNSLVSKAAMDTLEILDHIRDLGLQEIGMRWAWIDGVTHKDWAKYHQLKTKFDEWRYDVEKVATGHSGLTKARLAAEDVENQAMSIAEEAAAELIRLKETGTWKISAKDASDDFNTKFMPAAAAVAGQKIVDKLSEISEAVAPSSQGVIESIVSTASSSVDSGISAVSSLAASASESVVGTSQGTVESLVSVGSKSASSLVSRVSQSVAGTEQGKFNSLSSVVQESRSSLLDHASSSVLGTSQGSIDSISSVASSLVGKASSSIVGAEPDVAEKATQGIKSAVSEISHSASSFAEQASSSVTSGISEVSKAASAVSSSYSSATSSVASSLSESISEASDTVSSATSSAANTASKKVWGGAMAQHVEARQIIFEDAVDTSDDNTYSEKLQSMAGEAGDRYSDITKAVSEALMGTSSFVDAPVTKLAADQYSRALSAASVALYGTEQGSVESISSAVSIRYTAAVAAASSIIYGTATPTRLAALESISSVAQSKLSEGLSAASAQFDNAKSYVSAINTAQPAKQKLLAQMQDQYYAGIGMAHARYSEFVDVASSAIMPRQTPFHESLYSKASENFVGTSTHKFQAALNTASAHYSSAMAAASSQYDDIVASINKIGGGAAKDVIPTSILAAVASSRYNAAVSKASESFASINSVISAKLESGASAASSVVIGSETPWTESVASVASENWEALVTKASSQVYGAPTPYFVTRSLLSEAREYAAQATEGAIAQYAAVQSLIGELVSGKEADFTESVYSRLSSAYNTGLGEVASSASSYASEAYASASSVVSLVFTPPPTIEAILDSASSQVDAAVNAASNQLYGTERGSFEKATSAAASVQSVASEKIYGSSTGYAEAAQSSIADAAASAQSAILEAFYGTPTGVYESATNAAGEAYSTAVSVVGGQYSSVKAQASQAIYGPEKGAVESAQARLAAAVESARVRLADFASSASEGASEAVRQASEGVEDFASSVSSVISSATSHDEL